MTDLGFSIEDLWAGDLAPDVQEFYDLASRVLSPSVSLREGEGEGDA